MRRSSRVCLGNNENGDAFLVLCFGMSAQELLDAFIKKEKKYKYLVMFDGSQAFWVRKREGLTRMVIDGAGPDSRDLDPVYSLRVGGSEVGWTYSSVFALERPPKPPNGDNFWKRGGNDGRTEKCFIWTQ
jgi:hypothetical protein